MAFISEAARYARTDGTNFTASATTNYSNSYPANTFICLAVNAPSANAWTTMTVSDDAGNTYTLVGAVNHSSTNNHQLARFYCKLTNPVTTGTVITAAVTGGITPAKWTILAAAFDDDPTLDVQTSAVGGSTTPSSGSVTGTAANQLLFGAMAFTDANGTINVTPDSGWTNAAKATASAGSAGRTLVIGWRYVTSTGNRTYANTLASSQGWAAAVLAFTTSGSAAVATYTRSNRIVINATGSTNPTLAQASGPTATIDSSGNPIFVISEPNPFNATMSFTLTGTSGAQTATETIVIDPPGSDLSGRLVYDGTDWK